MPESMMLDIDCGQSTTTSFTILKACKGIPLLRPSLYTSLDCKENADENVHNTCYIANPDGSDFQRKDINVMLRVLPPAPMSLYLG